ncbi:hypothetical protein KSX_12340 [Ktedonospora formicarum]|uniref:DUF4388 domain-containing protein n=1 Tax=Ktedonospora formicarum TaxID=2778364 RepID=A0A8J3HTN4_9CHLR|nr:hypothetical protein KSX_12340 [Ktedonospora formicarum]
MLIGIRDRRSTGRLSIRSCDRHGLVHFYFQNACLMHVMGDRCDGDALLNDLLGWRKANLRFDPDVFAPYEDVTWQQAELFTRWLGLLEVHGETYNVPPEVIGGLTKSLTSHLPLRPLESEFLPESELETSGLWKIVKTDLLVDLPDEMDKEQFPITQVLPRIGGMVAQVARVSQNIALRIMGKKPEPAGWSARRGAWTEELAAVVLRPQRREESRR